MRVKAKVMALFQGGWLNHVARRQSGWLLIIKILHQQRFRVAAVLVATLGVYASGLSIPIVTQNIIDGITSGKSVAFLCMLISLAIVLSIADVVFADIRRLMVINLGLRVDRHISLEIMTHVLNARIDTADRNTGEILNRTEQTGKVKDFLIDLVPGSVFDIFGAVIAAIVICAYSIACGLSVLLIAAVGFMFSKRVLHNFYANVSLQFKLSNEKQGYLAETVGGLTTIKALAIEPARFRLWALKIKALVNAYASTEHILRRFLRATRMSQHLLTLAVVGIGGFEMLHGVLSVGDLFAIMMLTGKVSTPLLNAADVARQFQEAAVAVSELGSLLDAPQDQANVSAPVRAPLSGGINFHEVTYRYGSGAIPAIAKLSLRLPATGLVAIIGRNGSGKSTMLRLIQGLLRDFEGDLLMGDVEVRSYHPRSLRSQMAVVNQDAILFAGTIRENVTCWAPGIPDADVEAALHLASAWDFVTKLPTGLNTRLIENAANLSGGERQRLSVARAVLRDPKIILLDEPTASLDAEAAVGLERRLCNWGESRLMILVTHHLAAARLAETIIVMDKGSAAAQGSHNELLGASELYRSLWNDYLRGSGLEHIAESGTAATEA
jgi:ABC-type bacteriocin/lantibiotic exporter with double-glycine peptidase domain